MSLKSAGSIITVAALDVTAGLLTSTVVELIAPPIGTQSFPRLVFEGLVQLCAITYVGIEVAQAINRVQKDPTRGIPFTWGLFIGMPNTIAKLSYSAQFVRTAILESFSEDKVSEAESE